MNLDELLAKVNELKGDRQESDISPTDPYWTAVNEYRIAYNNAGQVHKVWDAGSTQVEEPATATPTDSDPLDFLGQK